VTAAELYELVRDLPEVIPEGLRYYEMYSAEHLRWWLHRAQEDEPFALGTALAADLILAGVVRKLLSLGSIEGYYGATDLIVVEVEGADELWAQGTGPTLLSAALAAYRKAKP
jgi:hypothetical protein